MGAVIADCFCDHLRTAVLPLTAPVFLPHPRPHLITCQGEICLCTSRIYVERSIFKEFVERLVTAARKWKTGDPSDPNNNNGALISKEHLEKVTNCQVFLKIIMDWIYKGLF